MKFLLSLPLQAWLLLVVGVALLTVMFGSAILLPLQEHERDYKAAYCGVAIAILSAGVFLMVGIIFHDWMWP